MGVMIFVEEGHPVHVSCLADTGGQVNGEIGVLTDSQSRARYMEPVTGSSTPASLALRLFRMENYGQFTLLVCHLPGRHARWKFSVHFSNQQPPTEMSSSATRPNIISRARLLLVKGGFIFNLRIGTTFPVAFQNAKT